MSEILYNIRRGVFIGVKDARMTFARLLAAGICLPLLVSNITAAAGNYIKNIKLKNMTEAIILEKGAWSKTGEV